MRVSRQLTNRPRVVLLGSGDRANVPEAADQIRAAIAPYVDVLLIDLQFEADLSSVDADFVIVLGGDGSILRAAHQMGANQLPVVGVNLGRLGFLAALQPEEFLTWLPGICGQSVDVVEHLMLAAELQRPGQAPVKALCLNEIAIYNGFPFRMIDIDWSVDGQLATTYSSDGLILATPVGSTAHALSTGGPIVRKDVQAVVIAAINPHTLTVRPVVTGADGVFEFRLRDSAASATLLADGIPLGTVTSADCVRVERADSTFKMVAVAGHNYFRTLREKLGWDGNLVGRTAGRPRP